MDSTNSGEKKTSRNSTPSGEPIITKEFPVAGPFPGSLRDWFAGLALQGLLASPIALPSRGMEVFAKDAYSVADKMLAEREKQP